MKMCQSHPETAAVNGAKCRDCYNTYMREYNLARYHRIRAEAIAALGGECVDCNVTEDLEFDHLDRYEKSFDVGRLLNYSKLRRDEELKKCVLRCGDCHRAKTKALKDYKGVPHGEGIVGKRKCQCGSCAPLKETQSEKFERLKIVQEHEAYLRLTTCACGRTKARDSGTCLQCANDAKKVDHYQYPEIEELILMLKKSNFSAVGRELGMTDNAIRKYLKRNGVDPKSIKG
jgi:hypothetical protein